VAHRLRRYGGSLVRNYSDFSIKRKSMVAHLFRSRSGSLVKEIWWLIGKELS
jgi:hypothetical protein